MGTKTYALDVWIVASNSKESDRKGEWYGNVYYHPEGAPNWILLTEATDSQTWTTDDDPEGKSRGDNLKIGSTEFQLSTSVTYVEVKASIKEYDPSVFDADEDLGTQTVSIPITRFFDRKSINLSCGSGETIELEFTLYEKTSPSGVTIYRDSNYQGTTKTLGSGSYENGSFWEVGNDQVTSLEVPPGWKVTLYENSGFTGRAKTFTQNTSYVGDDFNDITSSIKVEKIETAVITIYQDSNYQGASQTLSLGSYDSNSLGSVGNDQVSSLKVPQGLKVTLYENSGFTGRTKTFTGDTAWVGDDFNDSTSGIKIEKVS